MSLERSFFILETPVCQPDLARFVGRIVADPKRPLERFIPSSDDDHDGNTVSHHTNTILPGILPRPRITKNQKEMLSSDAEASLGSKLSSLFEMEFSRNEGHSRLLECEQLKTYSMENIRLVFKKLMQSPLYAKHAEELLRETWPHEAYFVTGFITATNSKWTITDTVGGKEAVKATLPMGQLSGVPAELFGGSLDTGGQANKTLAGKHLRQMSVEAEEIIAVSYFTVKLSYTVDFGSGSITRAAVFGKARRAKNNELAMGGDDDEQDEVEYDSSSDAEVDYDGCGSQTEGSITGTAHHNGSVGDRVQMLDPLSPDNPVALAATSKWL